MPYKFNPLSGSLDYYAGGSGDLWSDPIDSDITVDTDLAHNVGTSAAALGNIWAQSFFAKGGSIVLRDGAVNRLTISDNPGTLPSSGGSIGAGLSFTGTAADGLLAFFTQNDGTASANATATLRIETGNKTAGTGDGGIVWLQPGTSTGGADGYIYLDGGIRYDFSSYSANTTIPLSDYYVAGTISPTLTLPDALPYQGKVYVIQNLGTGTVTVTGDGSDTVGGFANYVLPSEDDSITIISDAGNWRIIANNMQNRIETKTLSADTSTEATLTDLGFSNLIVGRWYTMKVQVTYLGADKFGAITINHAGSIMARIYNKVTSSGNGDRWTGDMSVTFEATATTVTVDAASLDTGTIEGNGTLTETWSQIEERNDLIETTAF